MRFFLLVLLLAGLGMALNCASLNGNAHIFRVEDRFDRDLGGSLSGSASFSGIRWTTPEEKTLGIGGPAALYTNEQGIKLQKDEAIVTFQAWRIRLTLYKPFDRPVTEFRPLFKSDEIDPASGDVEIELSSELKNVAGETVGEVVLIGPAIYDKLEAGKIKMPAYLTVSKVDVGANVSNITLGLEIYPASSSVKTAESAKLANLFGPWHRSDIELEPEITVSGDQTFTVFFDEAFFKYLPDFGGSNEVIVIFKFKEGGSEENALVKIIGPMTRTADGTYSQQIGKVSYGPKRLMGDSVNVQIQIIEFDAEEREARGSFLDFVGQAASNFNIANPVTATEIRLAKEIAKTLNDFDQNDEVLNAEFEILPVESGTLVARNNKAIPLRAGNYGIIKQEAEPWAGTPLFFTEKVKEACQKHKFAATGFLFSLPIDLLLSFTYLPIKSLFGDSLDVGSTTPIKIESPERPAFTDDGQPIVFEKSTRSLFTESGGTVSPYKSKTWMTFAIEVGRSADLWEVRRKLSDTEATLGNLLNAQSVGEIVRESKVNEAILALEDVKQELRNYRVKYSKDGKFLLQFPSTEEFRISFREEGARGYTLASGESPIKSPDGFYALEISDIQPSTSKEKVIEFLIHDRRQLLLNNTKRPIKDVKQIRLILPKVPAAQESNSGKKSDNGPPAKVEKGSDQQPEAGADTAPQT